MEEDETDQKFYWESKEWKMSVVMGKIQISLYQIRCAKRGSNGLWKGFVLNNAFSHPAASYKSFLLSS